MSQSRLVLVIASEIQRYAIVTVNKTMNTAVVRMPCGSELLSRILRLQEERMKKCKNEGKE